MSYRSLRGFAEGQLAVSHPWPCSTRHRWLETALLQRTDPENPEFAAAVQDKAEPGAPARQVARTLQANRKTTDQSQTQISGVEKQSRKLTISCLSLSRLP